MQANRIPLQNVVAVADAVAGAADVQAAYDVLITEVSRALDGRAALFERTERGWILVAQNRGGLRVALVDLHAALEATSTGEQIRALDLRAVGESVWTSMSFEGPRGSWMRLLISGDWTILDRMLAAFPQLLTFALRTVAERDSRRRAEHLLVDGYTMARRLSRLGGVDAVCARVVQQVGQSLGADRVSIALYRPEEDRLAIVATHGYAASIVQDVRIEPGSWVVGHVFSSGRPVLVPDTRQLDAPPPERRQPYRTFSFAAVPLFAGTETLGVLTATDKSDGSAFDRQDIVALRTFAVSSALALMAARSDSEVHRLAYAATVDALTGLFNRTYLDGRLHQEVERAKRGATSLAVLMADIDDFKRINDSYGHLVGDAVLQAVGGILRSAVRVFDVCARYGGDEFAILMPSSDHPSAAACAERIRVRVSEYYMHDAEVPPLPPLTMSVGVAVFEGADAPPDLIRRADQCLYQAKAEGKNRVKMNSPVSNVRPMPFIGRGAGEPNVTTHE
jgi:diguanylate cyclase (GGDEF)-like protein